LLLSYLKNTSIIGLMKGKLFYRTVKLQPSSVQSHLVIMIGVENLKKS